MTDRSSVESTWLADACTQHGYPWRREGEPRAGQFRVWSGYAPGLPPSARPMPSMRQRWRLADRPTDSLET